MFKMLVNLLKQRDKQNHFVAGFFLSSIFLVALDLSGIHGFQAYGLAILLATLVGFGFEAFSAITKIGHPDMWDGVATALGALPTIFYLLI